MAGGGGGCWKPRLPPGDADKSEPLGLPLEQERWETSTLDAGVDL